MKTLITLKLILFLTTSVFGQFAIIQDKDGFTNVRSEPDANSKIIYKLRDNEVFFYYEDTYGTKAENTDWIPVMIPKNQFSIRTDNFGPHNGYIHKSRLKPLDELEEVTECDIQLVFNISKVDTSYKKVDKINEHDNSNRYSLFDGFIPYGLDIHLYQSTEVTSFDLICGEQIIPQSNVLVQDLYNVSFETGQYKSNSRRFKNYENDGVTFIHQECADGGGYYEIVWVIEQQRIRQRLAGQRY